jgi:hypothetical protein
MRRLLIGLLLGIVVSMGTTGSVYADHKNSHRTVELNHNGHVITVSAHAANKHLAHGDTVFICGNCGW